MITSVHGHEIMQLIHEADPPLTREQLVEQVKQRFGEQVEFHACAGGGMTLDDLLDFLFQRGKVVEVDGQLSTDIGLMCNHDGEHDQAH